MGSKAHPTSIDPKRVRYIKLGRQGTWEQECLDKGIVRLGFGSASSQRFELCISRQWAGLSQSFLDEGRDRGTATRFTNETRLFFEDDGSILWITFIGEKLYWGFLEPESATPHEDGDGVFRRVKAGWKTTDQNGEPLTSDRLSGAVTKLAAYRGTSCDVDVKDSVIRRINGHKTPEVERAIAAVEGMKSSALEMMKLLGPKDFETLIDLVFSTSGWRRQGAVGGRGKRSTSISFSPVRASVPSSRSSPRRAQPNSQSLWTGLKNWGSTTECSSSITRDRLPPTRSE